jgi:hypothetical protein
MTDFMEESMASEGDIFLAAHRYCVHYRDHRCRPCPVAHLVTFLPRNIYEAIFTLSGMITYITLLQNDKDFNSFKLRGCVFNIHKQI